MSSPQPSSAPISCAQPPSALNAPICLDATKRPRPPRSSPPHKIAAAALNLSTVAITFSPLLQPTVASALASRSASRHHNPAAVQANSDYSHRRRRANTRPAIILHITESSRAFLSISI
ncbi:hypothetical protein M0R45_001171 [Rubus argutus]|uniref:Uncharacterized protein n=1 Tax=Rubus argutus TaxID=59490 RepID=A0AAW1VN33_RUBAR